MKNIFITIGVLIMNVGLMAQCFEADATIWEDTWASCATSPNPKAEYGNTHWIQYDLSSVRKLSKSWIWNTNDPDELDRGFRDVRVDYSNNGEDWTHWGNFTFLQGTGEAIYSGFSGPDLVGVEARYILFTSITNYGDASCFGLAEVKFNLLPDAEGAPENGSYEDCFTVMDADVVQIGEDAVEISWEPLGDEEEESETFFLVEYRLFGSEEWQVVEADYDAAFINNLLPLETYEYQITTLCTSEASESATGTFTLSEENDNGCPTVNQIIIEWVGATEAFISWSIESEVEYGQELIIFTQNEEEDAMEFLVDEPVIHIQNLNPSTSYTFYIVTFCEELVYPSEFLNFTTTAEGEEACRIVEDIAFEQVTPTAVNLSWGASQMDQQYVVRYTPLATENWLTIETSETSLIIDNLLPNEEYRVVVGVYCNGQVLENEGVSFINDGTVSTEEANWIQGTAKLYPNPTRGLFILEYSSSTPEQLNYQLLTTLGQVVQNSRLSYNSGQQQFRLDLSDQPDGVYYLQLTSEDQRFILTERIVKLNGG